MTPGELPVPPASSRTMISALGWVVGVSLRTLSLSCSSTISHRRIPHPRSALHPFPENFGATLALQPRIRSLRHPRRTGAPERCLTVASQADSRPDPPPLPTPTSRASLRSLRPCVRCQGKTTIACDQCGGTGSRSKGVTAKKNPVNVKRVLGSKWTARERTFGWHQFYVKSLRKEGKETYLEMAATCDENTQFWV